MGRGMEHKRQLTSRMSLLTSQVFGYPGGAILPVFDAIHESKHFDFVLPRHEQVGLVLLRSTD